MNGEADVAVRMDHKDMTCTNGHWKAPWGGRVKTETRGWVSQ